MRRLPSFSAAADTDTLYDEFRNGLAHESRIKRGAQFSLDMDPERTYVRSEGVSLINPGSLLVEIELALDAFIHEIDSDSVRRAQFIQLLQADHEADRE